MSPDVTREGLQHTALCIPWGLNCRGGITRLHATREKAIPVPWHECDWRNAGANSGVPNAPVNP